MMRFSIRTLLLATLVIATGLFVFLAEYEFTQLRGQISATSPDGQYRIELVSLRKRSMFRRYEKIESRVYRNGKLGLTHNHFIGPPEIELSEAIDFKSLDSTDIEWSESGDRCKYPLTDNESVTIWLGNYSVDKQRVVSKNDE